MLRAIALDRLYSSCVTTCYSFILFPLDLLIPPSAVSNSALSIFNVRVSISVDLRIALYRHARGIRDTAVTGPTTTDRATGGHQARKTCAWPHCCAGVLIITATPIIAELFTVLSAYYHHSEKILMCSLCILTLAL